MTLEEYLSTYPLTEPRLSPANADERRVLGESHGVLDLIEGPPANAAPEDRHVPKKKGDPGCHLWAFTAAAIPYILERAEVAASLDTQVVKHSNLATKAACAGELWVDPGDQGQIYVNGCSGRFGPRSKKQLDAAVSVLRRLGYQVISFGWDDETNKPEMVLYHD